MVFAGREIGSALKVGNLQLGFFGKPRWWCDLTEAVSAMHQLPDHRPGGHRRPSWR
jgi:hypothetical protein